MFVCIGTRQRDQDIAKNLHAIAASASQPLKSGTLSLYLSVPVPVLTPSVVTSRPTTASRPSNPLNTSPLVPQTRLCWQLCAFINYIYLLTYLLMLSSGADLCLNHVWAIASHFQDCAEYVDGAVMLNVLQKSVNENERASTTNASAAQPSLRYFAHYN